MIRFLLVLALAGSTYGACTAPTCDPATTYANPVTTIQNMETCTDTTPAATKQITIMVDGDVTTNPFISLAVDGAKAECTAGTSCCLRVHRLIDDYTAGDAACAVTGAAGLSSLVIGVGFAFTDSIKQVAECEEDTKFGIIDVSAEGAGGFDNVAGVVFKEDEAGFLAGIIAGQVSVSKKLHVVAGVEIPPVKRYADGFKAGVEGVCPTCVVGVTYTGDFGNAGNIGPTTAQTAMADGADVIFGCGGFTGSQAIKYASSSEATAIGLARTGDAAWVIGVDADEWVSTFESGAVNGAAKVITSALKKVDTAAANLVKSLLSGRRAFVAGTTTLGAAENGVDYAPCHGACSTVTTAITDDSSDAKKCLSSGKIGVSKDATTCNLACTDIMCTFGTAYASPETVAGMATCTDTTPASTKKITVMVDGDMSTNPFIALAVDGAKAECTTGTSCCLSVHKMAADYTAADANCAVRGAADMSDMVMGVGFAFEGSIKDVSACHTGTKFGIIDATAESAGGADNVAGVVFKEDEAGFLAGVIAGFTTISKKLHVVAGVEIPPVVKYSNGFKLGVESACPTCEVGVTYTGDFGNAGNIGPTTAQTAMADGADVIFGCGGFTGSQAIKYASSSEATAIGLARTGDAAWVIGVDADEWVSTFESGAVDGSDKVITSALKKVDTAAGNLVKGYLSNFVKGTSTLGATEDGVDFAECHEACGDGQGVPDAATDVARLAKNCLASGSVDLGLNDDGTVPAGVVAPPSTSLLCDSGTSLVPSLLAALTSAIIAVVVQRGF